MVDNPIDLMRGVAGPSLAECRTLGSAPEVIATCKEEGVMLCASDNAGVNTLDGEVEKTDEQGRELVRLWRAFTQHNINYIVPGDPGISCMKSRWLVPTEVHESLSSQLADDCSEIRRLSTLPITRCFVYVDVSDFSQHRPGRQALIVGSLISMVRNGAYWNSSGPALSALKNVEAMLCIGDGYVFVLKNVIDATYFAAYLAQLIEVRVARKLVPVEFHFRMGVHVGPVYCFWDWGRGGSGQPEMAKEAEAPRRAERGDWNYIGEGINGGQRVLTAVGKETDDVLFISGQVRQEITAQNDRVTLGGQILDRLLNRGRRVDKHGKYWRVYEVNHASLCLHVLASAAYA